MSNHVLIVDDDGTWRDFLARTVERKGLVAESASTAHRAIELIKRQSFVLALIDPRLGPGSRYEDILFELKAKGAQIPTIIISGAEELPSIVRYCRENFLHISEFSKSKDLLELEIIIAKLAGRRFGFVNETGELVTGGSRVMVTHVQSISTKVFVGHGRSLVWLELRAFLRERLNLEVEDFNRIPVAGVTNVARLSDMLDAAAVAFLVLTGEDEQVDGTQRSRQNVVHEVGLFQGRLGFGRAIVLLEDGCDEFSNIHGLGQIRFPKGNVGAAFEEIRRVLEREGVVPTR